MTGYLTKAAKAKEGLIWARFYSVVAHRSREGRAEEHKAAGYTAPSSVGKQRWVLAFCFFLLIHFRAPANGIMPPTFI